MSLAREEITFDPRSFVDSARLFWWQGRLYRGITADRAGFYRDFLASSVGRRLMADGLVVETEPVDLQVDGYSQVLSHKVVPFVSYAHEWSPEMLREAAVLTLDIQIALAENGMRLQDAHPWNVLFDGPRPVHVDLGSIQPAVPAGGWGAYGEFLRFYWYPLLAANAGHDRIARLCLRDYRRGMSEVEAAALSGRRARRPGVRARLLRLAAAGSRAVPERLRPALRSVVARGPVASAVLPSSGPGAGALRTLRARIAGLALSAARTEWSDYYDERFPAMTPSTDWTVKHTSVDRVIRELRPKTVLDIGSNRGWYAQLAVHHGGQAVAFDPDPNAINRLYLDAKTKRLSLLPLIMDVTDPTPAGGLGGEWFPGAIQRLRCELVLALGLVHHLVFKEHLDFEQVVRALSAFTARWLVVEFVPSEDVYVSQWPHKKPEWYTVEKFREALGARFSRVSSYPSEPAPREILVCEV